MSDTCANPQCDNEVLVIGVCVSCANSDYKPERDGMEYAGYTSQEPTEHPFYL